VLGAACRKGGRSSGSPAAFKWMGIFKAAGAGIDFFARMCLAVTMCRDGPLGKEIRVWVKRVGGDVSGITRKSAEQGGM
jgi:hypothetical protein